ncbi:hypothetical protein [Ureibacillus thermosphaericus]|uniref:hypothetical protein n=1 Tax=Ureibacillus thermosphaericus TaxID=51173 RepID=UPI0030C976A9
MNKNQIIFMNQSHRNFNMYIGHKEKFDFFKDVVPKQLPTEVEKIISLDHYLKK